MGAFDSLLLAAAGVVGGLYLNNPEQVTSIIEQSGIAGKVAAVRASVNAALGGIEPAFLVLISLAAFYILSYLLEDVFAFFASDQPVLARLKRGFFHFVRKLPIISGLINKEVSKSLAGIEHDIVLQLPNGLEVFRTLPENPMAPEAIMKRLQALKNFGDFSERFKQGKVSGTIYVESAKHEEYNAMLTQAYSMFAWTNPLHMGIFPGVREMEAEIVRFGCNIFNGGPDSCGSVTSGGTESILMAVKSYRDHGREHRGITNPNCVLPRTAHPAFDKACQYLGITIRRVTEDKKTCKVRPSDVKSHMDENTIFIVGSCPQYPHGAIDPIKDLAKLALKFGCGLHVDCCLGSFVVPFIDIPEFDFRVKGVTSISADTHKYGYAPKGSSLVLYSNTKLHQCQFSVFPDWPGGIYGTPSMAGSRPGALVAATYCAMLSRGLKGYKTAAATIRRITLEVAEGIKKINGLRLMCEPESSVVAWTSDVFNVNLMVDGMIKAKKWDLNVLQFPAAVHICITMAHTRENFVNDFLSDLREATGKLVASPKQKMSEAAAVYGTTQSIPDRSIIEDIVRGYISVTYKLPAIVDSKETDKREKKHA